MNILRNTWLGGCPLPINRSEMPLGHGLPGMKAAYPWGGLSPLESHPFLGSYTLVEWILSPYSPLLSTPLPFCRKEIAFWGLCKHCMDATTCLMQYFLTAHRSESAPWATGSREHRHDEVTLWHFQNRTWSPTRQQVTSDRSSDHCILLLEPFWFVKRPFQLYFP